METKKIFLELIKSRKTVQDQIKEFKQRTGLSERTYYRMKRKLKKNIATRSIEDIATGVLITHNELRDFLVDLGKELGYETEAEYCINESEKKLRVDVVWRLKNRVIAFEIDLGGDEEKIMGDLIKGLMIADKHIMVVMKHSENLEKYRSDKVGIIPMIREEGVSQRAMLMLMYELLNSDKPVTEQIKEFKQRTGLSERTYYRMKSSCRKLIKLKSKNGN